MFRLLFSLSWLSWLPVADPDLPRQLQETAIETRRCPAAHWGPADNRYSSWTTHTNRLIPVYVFGSRGAGEGIDLASYTGEKSVYRDQARLRRLYRCDVEDSVDPGADWMDQTNVFDIQEAAVRAGRKHIFVVVFDGMDWHTTRAAAIWNRQRVAYHEGRGVGTHFQEYDADGTTQFGWMVTSPCRDGMQVDVDAQRVKNPLGGLPGGYCAKIAGRFPWSSAAESQYLVAGPKEAEVRHAYTDSAASATSMFCGVKTYNGAIGVDVDGRPVSSIAHLAQAKGYKVGAVTSVPISHATPAATYGHNVSRDDYQDLSRDLLGLPSVAHPESPLDGLDVVIGCGDGIEVQEDKAQGANFAPGNKYLAGRDLRQVDVRHGGRYVVARRVEGIPGGESLQQAAEEAAQRQARLLGFYGVHGHDDAHDGHLPFATADGRFDPVRGVAGKQVDYSAAEILENPTLAEMASAALSALTAGGGPVWLMVEAGDVDWANHENNLDASIGAVNSGDAAVRVITKWVEQHSNWDESILIVTADHGHYLVLDRPELLVRAGESSASGTAAGERVDAPRELAPAAN